MSASMGSFKDGSMLELATPVLVKAKDPFLRRRRNGTSPRLGGGKTRCECLGDRVL